MADGVPENKLFVLKTSCSINMNLRIFLASLLACLVLNTATAGPAITRLPYLQSASPTQIVIRWRTDEASLSLVRYGLTTTALNKSATSSGKLTEHIVLLEKLLPDTKYFYSIVIATNQVLLGGDSKHFFVTPPLLGNAKSTRVWILGDAGTYNTQQLMVRDAFLAYTAPRLPDLILLLGDNAYPNGTDANYQAGIFNIYPDTLRNVPLWPSLGNHDARHANSGTQSGVYFDAFTLPTLGQCGGVMSGTEAYYSFDYANMHFICLDSDDSDRSPHGLMAEWLRRDLATTKQTWVVSYFHHPPYTKGTHDSDNPKDSEGRMVEMRENILPILEAGGADLVLTGHSHVYERTSLVDSHYGNSASFSATRNVVQGGDGRVDPYLKRGRQAHSGTVYVVSGSAGRAGTGKFPHPANVVSIAEMGSFIIDTQAQRLMGTFLNGKGQVRDLFTIQKVSLPTPAEPSK